VASNLTVVVLAAGGGTRMKSKTMKVLHQVGGRSMIGHVLNAVQAMEPARIVAVVGTQREQVGPHILELVPDAVLAVQETQDGTGHAVQVALEALRREGGTAAHGTVVVVTGDTPLLRGDSLRAFAEEHEAAQRVVSILSGRVADPFGYGRIVRNAEGDVEGIVEEKDATPEQREIDEINSGILAFDADFLVEALGRVGNDNAKGEYYLTDTVGIARADGLTVGAFPVDDVKQTEGANDRAQLAALGAELNRRIVTQWMKDGVTVMDPATTWIDADVVLAPDVTILPGVQLLGATVVGEDTVIGPDSTLKDCEIGAGARVSRTHGELCLRTHHPGAVADLGVLQGAVGADHRVLVDPGGTDELGAGQDGDVGGELDVGVDPGRGRVHHGDPVLHPPGHDPLVEDLPERGELGPVVGTLGLGDVVQDEGVHAQPVGDRQRDRVGEVELLLGVVVADPGQYAGQEGPVEGDDPRVDLGDRPLRVGGVLLLDDPADPRLVPQDPAVAERLRHDPAQDRRGPACGLVVGHQRPQRLTAEQRRVAVRHQDGPTGDRARLDRHPHRVGGAELLGLDGDHSLGEDLGDVRLDQLPLVTHDRDDARRTGLRDRGQHMADEAPARDLVKHLRSLGLHPGAASGGQHDHGELAHVASV